MRIITRQILGDQAVIFTDTHTRRLIVDQPATNQHIAVTEFRQRMELLNDHAFLTVRAIDASHFLAILHNANIGTFTGEQRLNHIMIQLWLIAIGKIGR